MSAPGHGGAPATQRRVTVILLVLCILLLVGLATWEFARAAQGQSLGIGGSVGGGPVGPAGPAGASGADGRNGLDGVDGKDGADGIDGVLTTSTGSLILGQGTLSLGSCDEAMNLAIDTTFRSGTFFIKQVHLSDISGDCDGQNLSVFFAIKDTGPQYADPTTYALNDVVVCTRTLALDPVSDANTVDLIPGTCSIDGSGSGVSLGEVSTQDLLSGPGAIGVEVTG